MLFSISNVLFSLKESCHRRDNHLADALINACDHYLAPCLFDSMLQFAALCDPRVAFLPKMFDAWDVILEQFIDDKGMQNAV
jgi:hypothetical protein